MMIVRQQRMIGLKTLVLACGLMETVLVIAAPAGAEGGEKWYRGAFQIKAGDQILDTASQLPGDPDRNFVGHAAPHLVDMNGDSKRDLVLGTFSGRFRLHLN